MKNNFWKPAILGGIIAGVIMLILEMVMNPLFLGIGAWAPSRMIGAILLGSSVLPPPNTFDLGVFMAAAGVHFPLSVLYAIIIGAAVKNISTTNALITGAVIGLAIYLVNFYVFTGLFPWFAEARNWVQIVIHMAFGLSAAWSFKAISRKETSAESKVEVEGAKARREVESEVV